jgi:sensitive to high expression protein 9, mitochondrial
MQSLPYSVLRQSLRSSTSLAKTFRPRPSQVPIGSLTVSLLAKPSQRDFTIFIRCRFHVQARSYSFKADERHQVENLLNIARTPSGTDKAGLEAASTTSEIEANSDKNNDEKEPEASGLPSEAEERRSQLSKQFTGLMDDFQSNIFIAGQRLNDLTGYSAIEKLRKDTEAQGRRCNAHIPRLRWHSHEWSLL